VDGHLSGGCSLLQIELPVGFVQPLCSSHSSSPHSSPPDSSAHVHSHASPIERTYGELFAFLFQRGHLALGLYRRPGRFGAATSYVATNPLPSAPLHDGDRVFILTRGGAIGGVAAARS
jgi:hypothetical protein